MMNPPDELHDLTADEVDDESLSLGDEVRVLGRVAFLLACFLCVVLPLWFGMSAFTRATDNWFDGYGFTPFTHRQEIVPASFTPASVTWTIGEAAQR